MKTDLTLIAILAAILLVGVADGQTSSTPVPLHMDGHPQVAASQMLPTGGGYTSGTGDRPASDFPNHKVEKSLGEVARANREAHKSVPQSKVVFTNY